MDSGPLVLSTWDEFQVYNDSGILLLDARRQDAMGEDRSADPAIRRALAGEEVMRLRGPMLEMVHAVSVEGTVRGLLLAAIPLASMQEDLELALRSQVRFDSTRSADSRMRTVVLAGETWLICSVVVYAADEKEAIGSVTLTRSLSKELSPLIKDLLVAIGLGTGAGIFLAVVLAFLLSRALSAPISALVSATRRLGKRRLYPAGDAAFQRRAGGAWQRLQPDGGRAEASRILRVSAASLPGRAGGRAADSRTTPTAAWRRAARSDSAVFRRRRFYQACRKVTGRRAA